MNNQNQNEFSFEELVGMANFELDEKTTTDDTLELSLKQDEPEEIKTDDEPKLEGNKETVEVVEKKDEPIVKTTDATFYSELVKEKLDSGEWDDLLIDLGEEGEKKLSDLSNLDKETFKEIEKTILDEKQKIFETKYVDVDGLSETQVKLINIIKNGDLDKAKELFDNPKALQEPFQGYDSDNDEHNEQVLYWYYQSRGDSQEEAQLLVDKAKKDLSLDKKAQQIVDFQKKAFTEKLEKTNQELLEERQQEENNIKEYRKNLSLSLKQEGLGETAVRKFVDAATKKDKTGNIEIDSVYEDIMKDATKAKDLIYFMLDKENYIKKLTAETKKNVHVDNLRKIKIIQDTGKDKTKKEEDTKPVTNNAFSNLSFD